MKTEKHHHILFSIFLKPIKSFSKMDWTGENKTCSLGLYFNQVSPVFCGRRDRGGIESLKRAVPAGSRAGEKASLRTRCGSSESSQPASSTCRVTQGVGRSPAHRGPTCASLLVPVKSQQLAWRVKDHCSSPSLSWTYNLSSVRKCPA